MKLMSRTAALRLTASRFRVRRDGYQFRAYDAQRNPTGVTHHDYWAARDIAMRWRAEETLRLMGMDRDNAAAGIVWAIERGETTVAGIVACAAKEL